MELKALQNRKAPYRSLCRLARNTGQHKPLIIVLSVGWELLLKVLPSSPVALMHTLA